MRISNRIQAMLGSIILLMGCGLVQAQFVKQDPGAKPKKGLQLDLFPDAPKPRSNAPIGIEAKFSGLEPGKLVEGRLRIVLREGGRSLAVWESPELAISSGEIRFRFTLPPATAQGGSPMGKAQCSLLTTEKKTIDFGMFSFPLSTDIARNVTVATSHPELGTYPGMRQVMRALTLMRYDPEKEDAFATVDASMAYISPGTLGVQAMDYCAYDVLLLAGNGFSLVKEKQLEAMSTWVKAGGSVMVIPTTAVKAEHLAFLNRLSGGEAFSLNEQGSIQANRASMTPGHLLYRPGLGRMAVVFPDPKKDVDDVAIGELEERRWRKTVAHIYKFQKKQAASLVVSGKWLVNNEKAVGGTQNYPRSYVPANEYVHGNMHRLQMQPLPGNVGGLLADHLLPKDMRLVPGWAIFLVLFIFVLVIGPMDYIVLGKFKKRKYTWILFPLMSILFTVFMVKMAEHFMGTNDHRKTLRVVDVDIEGNILRQNRLTMYFTAKHKLMEEKGEGSLISLVNHEGLSNYTDDYNSRGMMDDFRDSGESYTGRIPGSYTFEHTVKQWTPTLVRKMTFGGEDLTVPTFWKDILPTENLDKSCARVSADFKGDILLIRSSRGPVRWGEGAPLIGDSIVESLSARFRIGWFSLVSAISPNGAGSFEDLALLDPTDSDAYVVAAIEERKGEIILYRCLYQKDAS
jgi:hypothetical protein